MSSDSLSVHILTSPHLKRPMSTDAIMRNVAVALLPVCLFSIFAFGLSALFLIVVATLSCVLTEWVICRMSGKPSTIGDYSAAVTGILLALTLPPQLPAVDGRGWRRHLHRPGQGLVRRLGL